jgi:hypothetical protein
MFISNEQKSAIAFMFEELNKRVSALEDKRVAVPQEVHLEQAKKKVVQAARQREYNARYKAKKKLANEVAAVAVVQ